MVLPSEFPVLRTLALHLFFLSLPFAFGSSFSGLGFRGRPLALLAGTLASIGLGLLALILSLFFPPAERIALHSKILRLPVPLLLLSVFLAPVSEEVFFRGFLLRKLGWFLSSLLFALFHFTYGSVYAVVGAFFLAIFLSFLRKLFGLEAAISAHFVFNLGSVAFHRLL